MLQKIELNATKIGPKIKTKKLINPQILVPKSYTQPYTPPEKEDFMIFLAVFVRFIVVVISHYYVF